MGWIASLARISKFDWGLDKGQFNNIDTIASKPFNNNIQYSLTSFLIFYQQYKNSYQIYILMFLYATKYSRKKHF